MSVVHFNNRTLLLVDLHKLFGGTLNLSRFKKWMWMQYLGFTKNIQTMQEYLGCIKKYHVFKKYAEYQKIFGWVGSSWCFKKCHGCRKTFRMCWSLVCFKKYIACNTFHWIPVQTPKTRNLPEGRCLLVNYLLMPLLSGLLCNPHQAYLAGSLIFQPSHVCARAYFYSLRKYYVFTSFVLIRSKFHSATRIKHCKQHLIPVTDLNMLPLKWQPVITHSRVITNCCERTNPAAKLPRVWKRITREDARHPRSVVV